jgi:hypothetical protein
MHFVHLSNNLFRKTLGNGFAWFMVMNISIQFDICSQNAF